MPPERRHWARVARWAVGLAIVGFAVRQVVANLEQFRATPVVWRLDPPTLLAAAVAIWAGYAVLMESWRRVAAALGHPIGWVAGARVWIVASMGKYLPGKVWAVAGLVYLAQRAGLPGWAATAAAAVNQALSIGAALGVAALLGAAELEAHREGATRLAWVVAAAALVATPLLASPAVLARVLRLLRVQRGEGPLRGPGPGVLAAAFAANVLAWLLYGAALWLLARGLLPGSGLRLGAAIAAWAVAYVGGVVALFAPGGLGVREGLLVLSLQGSIGYPYALALAAASRLLFTATEFGAVAPFLGALREMPRDRT